MLGFNRYLHIFVIYKYVNVIVQYLDPRGQYIGSQYWIQMLWILYPSRLKILRNPKVSSTPTLFKMREFKYSNN